MKKEPMKPKMEFFVRPPSTGRAQRKITRKLQKLEEKNKIKDFDVYCYPSEVKTSSFGQKHPATPIDKLAEINRWQKTAEVDLDPYFEIKSVFSEFSKETKEVMRTPTMALTVKRGGNIEAVYPCSRSDQSSKKEKRHPEKIREVIDKFETEKIEIKPRASDGGKPNEEIGFSQGKQSIEDIDEKCPECGEHLINGQGIYGCPECNRKAQRRMEI